MMHIRMKMNFRNYFLPDECRLHTPLSRRIPLNMVDKVCLQTSHFQKWQLGSQTKIFMPPVDRQMLQAMEKIHDMICPHVLLWIICTLPLLTLRHIPLLNVFYHISCSMCSIYKVTQTLNATLRLLRDLIGKTCSALLTAFARDSVRCCFYFSVFSDHLSYGLHP